MTGKKIRVLVADDSATVRYFLSGLINATPDMEVVGEASNGEEAFALAVQLKPDVISMDINMPRLDGLTATQMLMQEHPCPIVIVSSRIERSEVDLAFMALQAGALAVLMTPPGHTHPQFAARRDQFLNTLRAMSAVSVVRRWKTGPFDLPLTTPASEEDTPLVIVMGASAGGPMALHQILGSLPGDFPVPIAIVQHMAEGFIEGMVRWLNSEVALQVITAGHGQILRPGEVAIADSGAHLLLRRSPEGVQVVLDTTRDSNPYFPSVDRLFASAAEAFGRQAVGVLLTGMGEDGAQGLLKLRQSGAHTIIQDRSTCLVYGMPGAAAELGAGEQILPLKHIAPALIELARAAENQPGNTGG
ncbi:MAG: chemotaxis protein CheB [Anaerolineae bacterium]